MLRRHNLIWVGDALVAGSIYNQMLMMHNSLLKSRVKAIGDVLQGKLTPDVISPQQLNNTLLHLRHDIGKLYVGLKLAKFTLWDYYSLDDITSVFKNGTLYVEIPVKLEMMDQTFALYEINSFPVPIDSNSHQATIIMDHIDILAVNTKQNSYFPVSHFVLNEHCQGRTVHRCTTMFVNYDFETSPSCESAIYKNNMEQMKTLCKIGIMEVDSKTNPLIYDLKNSSFLVVNPTRQTIYSRCDDYERKTVITNASLVTITMQCFCKLVNEHISTPVYAGPHCIDQPEVEVGNKNHANLLFLAHMLNKTITELDVDTDYQIEKIVIPSFFKGMTLTSSLQQPVYDLGKIINLQRNNFQNSLHSRVASNTNDLNSLSLVKIIMYTVVACVSILIIIGILLTCRVKSLGHLLAIGKLLPTSQAPLDSLTSQSSVWSVSVEILSLVVLILAAIYWVYNHLALLRRILKYCAFPIKEFDLETKQPALTVLLYFSALTDWCYIHVDQLYALPHEVEISQSEIDIDVIMHEGCCSSYLTLTHKRLGIRVNSQSDIFLFNKTIAVPAYNRSALRNILNGEYKLQVLIGENKIYRSFNVILKQSSLETHF